MTSIVISGNTYFAYASVADADAYLLVYPDTTAWFALDADGKGKNLVVSANFIDTLSFKDAYDTQAEREVVTDIINASILLANLVANGNTAFLGVVEQEQQTKRLKAGSVEQEFFADINKFFYYNKNSLTYGLPSYIFNLLKPYLSSTTDSIAGSLAYGTDYTSTSSDPWDLTS